MRTVKGSFLKSVVDLVKEQKGPEGVTLLQEKMGNVTFVPFKDYPVELDVKFAKAACEVLYGNDSPQSYRNLGKLSARAYTSSMIGKTMISLLGNDYRRCINVLGKIIETVTSGLEITTKEVSDNKIVIDMKNIPYHIQQFEGIWLGAFEYFHLNPTITSSILEPEHYQYEVTL